MWSMLKNDWLKIIKNCEFCTTKFYKTDNCTPFFCISHSSKKARLSRKEFAIEFLKKERF